MKLKKTSPLKQNTRLEFLITRPQLSLFDFISIFPSLSSLYNNLEETIRKEVFEAAEIALKYSGYIDREIIVAEKLSRLDGINIDTKFFYKSIESLSTEARQKLQRIQPKTIGQAARIPGVSPSDINVLLVLLGR